MNKNFVNNVDIIYPELISSDGWLMKKSLLLKYVNNEELGALPQISEKLTEKSSKIDLLYRLLFLECVEIEYTYRFYHYSFKTLMLYDYCNEIEFFLKFIISKNNLETSELYRELFSEKTFEDFNTCYFCAEGNRRGVGFDKPQLGASGPTCGCASMTSFGHTGYTGTMAWADPETQIVYVFLSNRTFPFATENKLSKANIREDIQQVIYEAIIR